MLQMRPSTGELQVNYSPSRDLTIFLPFVVESIREGLETRWYKLDRYSRELEAVGISQDAAYKQTEAAAKAYLYFIEHALDAVPSDVQLSDLQLLEQQLTASGFLSPEIDEVCRLLFFQLIGAALTNMYFASIPSAAIGVASEPLFLTQKVYGRPVEEVLQLRK